MHEPFNCVLHRCVIIYVGGILLESKGDKGDLNGKKRPSRLEIEEFHHFFFVCVYAGGGGRRAQTHDEEEAIFLPPSSTRAHSRYGPGAEEKKPPEM